MPVLDLLIKQIIITNKKLAIISSDKKITQSTCKKSKSRSKKGEFSFSFKKKYIIIAQYTLLLKSIRSNEKNYNIKKKV